MTWECRPRRADGQGDEGAIDTELVGEGGGGGDGVGAGGKPVDAGGYLGVVRAGPPPRQHGAAAAAGGCRCCRRWGTDDAAAVAGVELAVLSLLPLPTAPQAETESRARGRSMTVAGVWVSCGRAASRGPETAARQFSGRAFCKILSDLAVRVPPAVQLAAAKPTTAVCYTKLKLPSTALLAPPTPRTVHHFVPPAGQLFILRNSLLNRTAPTRP